MIIDWYTVIFQIINFLILVFLLRRFLYGPIVSSMDARKAKLLQKEEAAVAQKEEALSEAEAYRLKVAELRNREEELKEKALTAAETEKKKLLETARKETEEKRRRWEEELEREKESFAAKLRLFLAEKACAVSEKCLKDLSGQQLESLIWEKFLEKIGLLDGEERDKFRSAFKEHHKPGAALEDNDDSPVLLSVFEPSPDMKRELEAKIAAIVPDSKNLKITYQNDNSLICGLELIVGSYSLAWNISDYLQEIEADILKEIAQDSGKSNSASKSGEVF